ncbi:MAG: DNA primase [Hyphomicrobiaceae bacterium]
MRFSPHLLDEIRARLSVSQVVARKVPLKKKGREFAGLSPFKSEKTPSFFVNDQKGFYHCFASGEHGDIFTFLMKTEGLSFPEAVERLADEAGVALPKSAPQDREREDERQRLYRLLETSAQFFVDELNCARGRDARRYLKERGLDDATIARFGIGLAPPSRSALSNILKDAGFTSHEMALSGMLIAGEDIREPYDRFRGRVMFPIHDTKARVIAFGGRALDPNVPAKYLNSPETPLFHKGHVLFNAATARSAGYEKKRIIAVEGYMDVVALSQSGFDEVVAPLGTALTEDQMKLMWRVAQEPILCFDGDSAGRKAADRAADTVLPHLSPGQSLTFAFLPDGLDPDDLVRQHGASGFEAILQRAKPLADVLFDRAWKSGDWSTPERRAHLEAQLNAQVGRIQDPAVRNHYSRDMRDRLFKAFRPGAQNSSRQSSHSSSSRLGSQKVGSAQYTAQYPGRHNTQSGNAGARRGQHNRSYGNQIFAHAEASDDLRGSAMVTSTALPSREALLIRTLLNHPWLIDIYAEDISQLEFSAQPLQTLRDAILSAHACENSLDRMGLRHQLTELRVENFVDLVERASTHRSDRFAEPDAASAEVETGWRHTLALHRQQLLSQSLRAAEVAFSKDFDEEAYATICQIKAELARLSELGAEEHDGLVPPTSATTPIGTDSPKDSLSGDE